MKTKFLLFYVLLSLNMVWGQVIITPNPFGVNSGNITITYGTQGDYSLFNPMGYPTIFLYTGLNTDDNSVTWEYHDTWSDINSLVPLHWDSTINGYKATFNFMTKTYTQESSGLQMTIPSGTTVNNWYFILRDITGTVQSVDLIGSNYGFTTQSVSNGCWKKISSSGNHLMGIKNDGSIWGVGLNSDGQVGVNQNTSLTQINNDNNWKKVSAGGVHTIALKEDGTLWAWGSNTYGQLGSGASSNTSIPIQIGNSNQWKDIFAGTHNSFAIKNDGSLWAWGRNNYGQLGDGTTTNRNTPTQINAISNCLLIAAGYYHTVAIKNDGSLWSWGRNNYGQLGDNTFIDKVFPVQIGNSHNWIKIEAGSDHNLAIKSDGTLWAWGDNFENQLGDGTSVEKNTPIQITNYSDWIDISAGGMCSSGIRNNNSLWSWGWNLYGQLGDGTNTNKNTPTYIPNINSSFVSVGGVSTAVLNTNNELFSFGYNYYGQLGNGNSNNSNIPISISCPLSSSSCITWTDFQPDSNYLPASDNAAFQYLCSNNVILTQQLAADIDNPIKREELAKVAFKALYKPNGSTATTPADNYPVPFIDLQPTVANYIREAKVLSYLEYGDGISAFNRSFTHFRPKDYIKKQHALKLLLETFNIAPAPVGSGNSWSAGNFTDVNGTTNFEMYYYLVKAYQLGIVPSASTFNPNTDITRRELFVWLYRLLTNTNITIPTPTVNDFYTTGNITPANFGRMLSINDGNFNNYSKTSFNLDGKMPLTFTHTYNSLLTELPEGYIGIEPLGKGWTHNYNCYIKEVDGGDGTTSVEPRTIIYWGDGTMNSFKLVGSNYVAETVGLYATLTKTGLLYEFTTKNKVRYQFNYNDSHYVLTSIIDRNNNTTTLNWVTGVTAVKPRLNYVETPGGRRLNFTYFSGTDLINKVTETGLNREVVFTFDATNTDLKTFKDPDNNTTTYIYEAVTDVKKNHLLKQIQLPKGNIIENTYENRKLKTSVMQGQYQTTVNQSFNYGSSNANNFYQTAVATTRDGQTITNTSQMNTLGNITSLQNPTANVSVSYGNTSHPTKPTNLSNAITGLSGGMVYDSNGNVTTITKTSGSTAITEEFTYSPFNDVATHKNGRGFWTYYTYNTTGNLTKIKDALNNETNIIPNPDGTTQKITNPEGIYTDFSYNNYGNVTATSLMGTLTNQVGYDNASRANSSTNPNGVITTMEYELNDMIKKVTVDPSGLNNIVQYQYDENDNLKKIINPMNGETVLDYNSQDQLQQYTFAGNNKQYTYNNDGTLKIFKDQNNVTFTNVYNTDGTLQTDGYATYTYNTDKTINTITRNGKILTFGYDALKRVTQVKYNDAIVNNNTNGVRYTYDANDNITSIEYPNGFKVGYEYDALDRLIRVYNFANNSNFVTYTYYNDGRLNQQTNGNGTKTIYSYDQYGRVSGISNQKSDGSVIYAQTYTMDNIGNHTAETTNEPFAPIIANISAQTISYTHDNANKMTNQGSNTYSFNNGNSTGNGNQTTMSGSVNATLTYDPKDNLLTSTENSITCEYDALENRRSRANALIGNNLFLLDIVGGNNVLMETNTSGTPTAYYIHGLGLIARLDANQANPSYYHYDYRGSTTAITNATQIVTHSYKYGPFGELMGSADNGFTNVYRYVGKYGVQYESNQLYFMRARYYNPVQGRFLGEDPIWNTNLYAYCDNNPINYVDPSGLLKEVSWLEEVYGWNGLTYQQNRLANNSLRKAQKNLNKNDLIYKTLEKIISNQNNDFFLNIDGIVDDFFTNNQQVINKVSSSLNQYLSDERKGILDEERTQNLKIYRMYKEMDNFRIDNKSNGMFTLKSKSKFVEKFVGRIKSNYFLLYLSE